MVAGSPQSDVILSSVRPSLIPSVGSPSEVPQAGHTTDSPAINTWERWFRDGAGIIVAALEDSVGDARSVGVTLARVKWRSRGRQPARLVTRWQHWKETYQTGPPSLLLGATGCLFLGPRTAHNPTSRSRHDMIVVWVGDAQARRKEHRVSDSPTLPDRHRRRVDHMHTHEHHSANTTSPTPADGVQRSVDAQDSPMSGPSPCSQPTSTPPFPHNNTMIVRALHLDPSWHHIVPPQRCQHDRVRLMADKTKTSRVGAGGGVSRSGVLRAVSLAGISLMESCAVHTRRL